MPHPPLCDHTGLTHLSLLQLQELFTARPQVISDAEDEGGESHDRASIALAADQMQMAKAVFAAVARQPRNLYPKP